MDDIKNKIPKIFFDKKFQWGVTVALFLIILAIGINIRYQPISTGHLIDATTGDYTPLALDPYYFLRMSETLIADNGTLPAVDNMRYQALNATWSTEIMPYATIFIYNTLRFFNPNTTLNFADVLNPVIFFALGIIAFFFLIYVLTKNKTVALSASFILTIIPPYLYRTLAGFSDHESIGIFGFFLALFVFSIGTLYLDKKKVDSIKISAIGILSGIATAFAAVAWGGGAAFLFMIMPLAFLIRWMTRKDKKNIQNILFYGLWIIGILIGAILFKNSVSHFINRFMTSNTGILTFATLVYMIIETIILKLKSAPKIIKDNFRLSSLILMMIIGGIFYHVFVGNVFLMFYHLLARVIYPFGTGRVGLTVAENKQPYVNDFIRQIGKAVFYIFLAGCGIVGLKLSQGIKKKKYRIPFILSFAFFIYGILFSRISSTSIFNGDNFISKALFFISFLTISGMSIYIYRKSKWTIKTEWILIASWMIPMLLAVRSAIRVFFAIVPFVSFLVPVAIYEIFNFSRKYKEDLIKVLSIAVVIISVAMLISASLGFYSTVSKQAAAQTPSYSSDWQKSMAWVRNNTAEGSVFLHWWDYGYWVETGGNRPSVTDGGHFNGYWDHLVGRYVLTTPYPETAKSFMKAQNVSYLLIDPSDIGKYSAYSSIGDSNKVSDRASYMPTMVSNPSDTRETSNGTIRIYKGGFVLDSDLEYNLNGHSILLPAGKAGLGAVVLQRQIISVNGSTANAIFIQPYGIYVYNGQQYKIPIRYLFVNGKLVDYKSGVNATTYVYANVYNKQFDQDGAVMYLSAKVEDSLVAQLYLMGDPHNEYPEITLVNSQSDYPFSFNYGGYRGPLNIYHVNLSEMTNIISRKEFTYPSGEYGDLDNLQFTYS